MANEGLFIARTATVDGVSTTYRVFVPRGVGGPMPLILFLHGAGESGSDGLAPTTVGIGPAIARDASRVPALVAFPQASRGYGWRGFNLATAIAALDETLKQHDVDENRLYVTGISMGGYGTWLLALEQPERFAAIAPVCGGLDRVPASQLLRVSGSCLFQAAAERIAHIPQWVFHGDADNVIPVEESRAMVAALRGVGAEVRYTEYENVKHNSWDRAYATAELLPWMLSQRRKR